MSLVKGPGWSAAHPRNCLPLLPSGPDGVHKLGLRWAWPRTIADSEGRARRVRFKNGGDERIRTADPLVANEVLSQLSYIPTTPRVWPAQPNRGTARVTDGSAL